MNKYDIPIRNLLREKSGLLSTAKFAAYGIPRTYLSLLEKNGSIERVAWGVYSATATANIIIDDMHVLQLSHQKAIFSHETALYIHGLSDRNPLNYSLTLPSGYHSKKLKLLGYKVFFVKTDLHQLGCVSMPSPQGNPLQVYDLERTLCDAIRSRSRIDSQIFTDAVKGYVKRREKSLPRLMQYAELFGINKLVRQYIEVLL